MVAISLSGSGEGLGRAIARGYSTGNDAGWHPTLVPSFPRKRESTRAEAAEEHPYKRESIDLIEYCSAGTPLPVTDALPRK